MDRRTLIAASLILGLAASRLAGPALAEKANIYTGLVAGVAVGGYDPVAYFADGVPRKGDPEIALQHEGAMWWFATAENKALFAADPDKYAPQYGGYCAWAVASGYTAKGDPEAWRIVDGRLYLNYSKGVQRRWARDIPGNIAKGNANWPDVLQ